MGKLSSKLTVTVTTRKITTERQQARLESPSSVRGMQSATPSVTCSTSLTEFRGLRKDPGLYDPLNCINTASGSLPLALKWYFSPSQVYWATLPNSCHGRERSNQTGRPVALNH